MSSSRDRRRSTTPLLTAVGLTVGILCSRAATVAVVLVKTDDWTVYTTGRVNGFLVGGVGDGYPQPLTPGETIIPGGGLDIGSDNIPTLGPDGMPVPGSAGTFRSLRVRSGFVPNVLGLGLRSQLTQWTTLNVYLAIWTTIGAQGQRKTAILQPDAREGYAKLEGPWGSLLVGRALDLLSRGAT